MGAVARVRARVVARVRVRVRAGVGVRVRVRDCAPLLRLVPLIASSVGLPPSLAAAPRSLITSLR